MRIFLVISFSAFLVAPLCAQNITINGVAWSASLMEALRRNCDNVNANVARRYQAAFMQVGRKSFGEQAFDAEYAQELPRRLREVADAGPRRWRLEQTEIQKKLGTPDLFED